MSQLAVKLPDDLAEWADQRAANTDFPDTAAYVSDLVARDRAAELAWLQAEIDKGRASGVIERPATEVLAEIVAKHRARYD